MFLKLAYSHGKCEVKTSLLTNNTLTWKIWPTTQPTSWFQSSQENSLQNAKNNTTSDYSRDAAYALGFATLGCLEKVPKNQTYSPKW